MTEHFPIIDAHTHVPSSRYVPKAFFADVADTMVAAMGSGAKTLPTSAVLDMILRQHQDHMADRMVQDMDEAGVSQAVLLVPDFSFSFSMPSAPSAMFEAHRDIMSRHPGRFFVFAGADPRHGKAGVERFERCMTEFGFHGLKLYPPCGYSPSDPNLDPYYEICEQHGAPVLLHTGPTAPSLNYELAHPLQVDCAARRFPKVNFILAHGGVTHMETATYLAQYRRNIYIDFSGVNGAFLPYPPEKRIANLLNLGLNDKILFGTDWPLTRMSGGLSKLTGWIHDPGAFGITVSKRDLRRVCHDNIVRLLPDRPKMAKAS